MNTPKGMYNPTAVPPKPASSTEYNIVGIIMKALKDIPDFDVVINEALSAEGEGQVTEVKLQLEINKKRA